MQSSDHIAIEEHTDGVYRTRALQSWSNQHNLKWFSDVEKKSVQSSTRTSHNPTNPCAIQNPYATHITISPKTPPHAIAMHRFQDPNHSRVVHHKSHGSTENNLKIVTQSVIPIQSYHNPSGRNTERIIGTRMGLHIFTQS